MTTAVILVDDDWRYLGHEIMPDLTSEQAMEMPPVEADALMHAVRTRLGFLKAHAAFAEFEGEFDPEKAARQIRKLVMDMERPKGGYTS